MIALQGSRNSVEAPALSQNHVVGPMSFFSNLLKRRQSHRQQAKDYTNHKESEQRVSEVLRDETGTSSSSQQHPCSGFQYIPTDLSSPPIKAVYEWCKAHAGNNVDEMRAVSLPSGDFTFHGDESVEPLYMLQKDLSVLCHRWWTSFPDGRMGWDRIEKVNETQAKVYGFHWFGHHTGAPWELEPYPPIEVTGIFVKDGPIDILFTVNEDGKVAMAEAWGNNSGPHGTYVKAGGFVF